jgi:hypothetical protein
MPTVIGGKEVDVGSFGGGHYWRIFGWGVLCRSKNLFFCGIWSGLSFCGR